MNVLCIRLRVVGIEYDGARAARPTKGGGNGSSARRDVAPNTILGRLQRTQQRRVSSDSAPSNSAVPPGEGWAE